MKIFLSLILSLSLMLSGVVASENPKQILMITEQSYERYLEDRGQKEPEALKIKDHFIKLSAEQKKRYIHYLNNPKMIADVLDTPLEENSKKELYNGDIVIKRETKKSIIHTSEEEIGHKDWLTTMFALWISPVYAAPKIEDLRVQDTRTVTWFGSSIPQVQFKAWVIYKSKDRKTVLSVQAGEGHVTNYYPLFSLTRDTTSRYVRENKATVAIVWKGHPPIAPYNIVSFNKSHHVIGHANGTSDYEFFNGV